MEYKWLINLIMPLGLIIYGLIYIKKSSRKPSNWQGYRTSRAMLSQETWEYANQRAGNLWIKLGVTIAIITGFLFLVFPDKAKEPNIVLIVFTIIISLIPMRKVEKELKELFDDEGNLKK